MKKKLLTNGKAFKRTDNRWGGTVWYMDELGERKRKSFSGTTKAEVNKKMTAYVAEFNQQLMESEESRKTLRESMTHWLQVFKFPSVERGTYDRCECTAKHQVYPLIGEKVVGNITSADLKSVLNYWLERDYAYTTVKKVHDLLGEYFRYLTEQELLNRNPMLSVPMMKKANFMAAQNKEDPTNSGNYYGFYTGRNREVPARSFFKIQKRKAKVPAAGGVHSYAEHRIADWGTAGIAQQ